MRPRALSRRYYKRAEILPTRTQEEIKGPKLPQKYLPSKQGKTEQKHAASHGEISRAPSASGRLSNLRCFFLRGGIICWGQAPQKICYIRIDAPLSRQPLVKGERLVRYEVSAAMILSKYKWQDPLCRNPPHSHAPPKKKA